MHSIPKRPLLAAVALVSLLAGCSTPGPIHDAAAASYLHIDQVELSQARFPALPAEEHWVTSSTDGAQLHLVLWRPDTSSDPSYKAPAILVDSPYRTTDTRTDPLNSSEMMNNPNYDWLITELVPRGYAVAYKEIRGTGESGGCLEQTAMTQSKDGYDAIEWLGTQSWSSGKVGMFGKSYLAEAQYSAARLAPPHLTTIVPIASVSGQYEWNFYDGVPLILHNAVGTASYIEGSSVPPGTTQQGITNYPEHYACQADMLTAASDTSGDWTPYWDQRELRKDFDNITASVLYVHGLQDWNVRQVAVRDSFEHIQSEKRLVLGQWHHDHPDGNTYKPEWSRTDWRSIVHAWYDNQLLGRDNGILARLPPVQVQDSEGAWRVEQTYPPTDTVPVAFALAADKGATNEGSLAASSAQTGLNLTFRENEEAFVRNALPAADLTGMLPNAPALVPDAPGAPPTSLVFTSAPLQAPLRFSGWPVFDFTVTLSDGLYPDPDTTTDAHFAADLAITECDAAGWINEGFLSARHRDGVKHPEVVPEDEAIHYVLRFSPADTVIPAGCKIQLTLAGSNADSQPEGSFFAALLTQGTLTFPTVERDLAQVGLDVPMASPA